MIKSPLAHVLYSLAKCFFIGFADLPLIFQSHRKTVLQVLKLF